VLPSSLRLLLFATLTQVILGYSMPASAQDLPATQPATQPAADNQFTSDDGTLTISLPANWTKSKPKRGYVISAATDDGEWLTVASHPQEDFVSFEAFAAYIHDYWMTYYEHSRSSTAQVIDAGGQAMIRYDITYEDKGSRWGMVMLMTKTKTRYNLVVVEGLHSLFTSRKDQWAALADRLVENLPAPAN
jgi:hypothetical protein